MQLPWRSLPQPPFVQAVRAPRRPSGTAVLLALLLLGGAVQWGLRRLNAPADPLLAYGALTAKGLASGHWWAPLTHLFLSTGPAWLWAVALVMLALTGRPLEALLGRRQLWQLFVMAGITGGLGQLAFVAMMHRSDQPVAGPAPAALGFLLALACASPKAPFFPASRWGGAWHQIKVLHGALAALAGAALAGTQSPAAGALIGGLTGCVYLRTLGFSRRAVAEAAASSAPHRVSAASSASWGVESTLSEPGPVPAPLVLIAPGTGASTALAAPRFTARERRMTPREFIAEKVDPILEKISQDGLDSLTSEERQILEKAREKMQLGS